MLLLGNKCDKEHDRVIPKRTGEELAHQYDIPFLETSHTTRHNISEAFEIITRLILKKVRSSNIWVTRYSRFVDSIADFGLTFSG